MTGATGLVLNGVLSFFAKSTAWNHRTTTTGRSSATVVDMIVGIGFDAIDDISDILYGLVYLYVTFVRDLRN